MWPTNVFGGFMKIGYRPAIRPILESTGGIHLSIYLENNSNSLELRSRLLDSLEESYEWISPVLDDEEKRKFFEPLESVFNDAQILKNITGNIGLFRNEQAFRILSLPVSVTNSTQVASSFHVKPILRWLQGDQEFLLLGFDQKNAYIYLGSQHTFKLISTFPYSEVRIEATVGCLESVLKRLSKDSQIKLFVAGTDAIAHYFTVNYSHPKLIKMPIYRNFNRGLAKDICHSIREMLKEDSHRRLDNVLNEFSSEDINNRIKKNIFQISKAVVEGRVQKLVVTDDLNIYGRIDLRTGGLSLHPVDLDHEDDCILDDLAQLVLNQGGEVVIAERNQIPQGRPILALLENEGEALQMKTEYEFANLQARVG
jgi:hypothetical protein